MLRASSGEITRRVSSTRSRFAVTTTSCETKYFASPPAPVAPGTGRLSDVAQTERATAKRMTMSSSRAPAVPPANARFSGHSRRALFDR